MRSALAVLFLNMAPLALAQEPVPEPGYGEQVYGELTPVCLEIERQLPDWAAALAGAALAVVSLKLRQMKKERSRGQNAQPGAGGPEAS